MSHPDARAVTITKDHAGVRLLDETWPPVMEFSDELVRSGAEGRLVLRHPWLTIRLDNAHAVYRVDTCEQGVWTGALVEGWRQP